jgi:hypothetical protein
MAIWILNLLLLAGLVGLSLAGITDFETPYWVERVLTVLLFASFACTGASRRSSTGASTAAATTLTRSCKDSTPACATWWTWNRSISTCSPR